MINKYNIADLSLQNRPVNGTANGFGAVIHTHPSNHGQRYFATENRDNFGTTAKQDPASTQRKFEATQDHCSGGQHRPIEDQKLRTLSNLTGEVYNANYDAQGQTDVQRSWLYQQDPSLRAANAGFSKRDQVAMFDNANSLCLGDGVQNLRNFNANAGAERHMRKDVTLDQIKNVIITKK